MRFTIFLLALFVSTQLHAQNAGINADGSLPDNSAMLDIKSANKGLLIPRIALTSAADLTTIPSPKLSLLIFNTATAGSGGNAVSPGFYFFNGTSWSPLVAAGGAVGGTGWALQGNAGVTAQQFLGTTDNKDLNFKINNQLAGVLGVKGSILWGVNAGTKLTTARDIIAIGTGALHENTFHEANIAIGDSALFNNGKNVVFSDNSVRNTAIGRHSMFSNTSGNDNVAVGDFTLANNTVSTGNTAIGSSTMFENISGSFNTAVGDFALGGNKTGQENLALGVSALSSMVDGSLNIAVGNNALLNGNNLNKNIAIGHFALGNSSNSSENIAIGFNAFSGLTSGSKSIALGHHTTVLSGALFNATAIGADAQVNCSSCMVLGSIAGVNSATTSVNVGIGVNSPTQRLHVGGNIVATGSITAFSDIRFKTNIQLLSNVLPSVLKINSIYYNWKQEEFPENHFGPEKQLGFSAQQIEEYFPEIVLTDKNGYKSVDYSRLTPILVQAIREQQEEIRQLKELVDGLLKKVEILSQKNK